jgi:hypothetical protein
MAVGAKEGTMAGTHTSQPISQGSSRKALLAGAAIGVAVVAADAASPGAAGAANGDPVLLGRSNTATSVTIIDALNSSNGALFLNADTGHGSVLAALIAENGGAGACVQALQSGTGEGTHSQSVNAEGLYARSGSTDGFNPGLTRSGVHGVTDSPNDSAVWGEAVSGGIGVMGSTASASQAAVSATNSGAGLAVNAISAHGTGLHAQGGVAGIQVDGAAIFSRSGIATIAGTTATPKSSVVVSSVALTAASIILAVVQGTSTVAVRNVVPNVPGSKFTIFLTKAVTSSVKVGWFVVN